MVFLNISNTIPPPQLGSSIGENGNWQCLDCGNVNFAHRNECNRCGQPKPQEVAVRHLRICFTKKNITTTCFFCQKRLPNKGDIYFFGIYKTTGFFSFAFVVVILTSDVKLEAFF